MPDKKHHRHMHSLAFAAGAGAQDLSEWVKQTPVDIPNDPFWLKHPDGLGTTPHGAPCRDIVHSGLNVRSTDGRYTGALHAGSFRRPAWADRQGHGSIMRLKMGDKGSDGIYPHEKMEVYAMSFRNQSGVEFGPKGSRFEKGLAVADNGMNDIGHRRIANANPNGYINPDLEWDTNSPIDGIAWSSKGFGADSQLFASVFGILTGPDRLEPTWPYVLKIEFLEPFGIKWSHFVSNIEPGGNAYQKPENRGGMERPNDVVFTPDGNTLYIVDYGAVHMNFNMSQPFYPVAKSGVIWAVTRN